MKTASFIQYYRSPIGQMKITADNKAILSISFPENEMKDPQGNPNLLTKKAVKQLDEYFQKKRTQFDLPLSYDTTPFFAKVWEKLRQVPFGTTLSYSQLSAQAGNEKAVRAAAQANAKNKFLIVLPCHRIIGKNGTLTGFSAGMWRKIWLLEHENILMASQVNE